MATVSRIKNKLQQLRTDERGDVLEKVFIIVFVVVGMLITPLILMVLATQ